MAADSVRTIAVIGAGLMGHGIAQDFAVAGLQVRLYDSRPEALTSGLASVRSNLDLLAGEGAVEPSRIEPALARIRGCASLAEAVDDVDLVLEAVAENLAVKQEVFRELDRLAPTRAILASNTSSLMPSSLAAAPARPDRVLVAHYFNPPYLVPLVELVRSPATSDATVATMHQLYSQMGKKPVVVEKEALGFIGNRLQGAMLREALNIVARGIATPEAVDTVVRTSFGRRLTVGGLFELRDLAGLEVVASVAATLYPDLAIGDEVPAPLRERAERGDYGVKTGRGFYEWSPEKVDELQRRLNHALIEIARWEGELTG